MNFENLNIGGKKHKVLTGKVICPEYMIKMITYNRTPGLIPFCTSEEDGLTKIIYMTDIMRPFREFLMENGSDGQWLRIFMTAADRVLAYCGEYLINPDFILMETESVFVSPSAKSIHFIFNPFIKNDFNDACRKVTADIAGNYYTDHGVSAEVLRERILRETGKKDFNIRQLLSRWNQLANAGEENRRIIQNQPSLNESAGNDVIKNILDRFRKKEHENPTTAVANTTGGLCLTGICSIDTRIPIKSEGVTVGRTMLQKEYGLYNSGIGKTHARVYQQDGYVYATDLGSRNGTYLNGELIDKRVPVKVEKGDILAFSDEEFILC